MTTNVVLFLAMLFGLPVIGTLASRRIERARKRADLLFGGRR